MKLGILLKHINALGEREPGRQAGRQTGGQAGLQIGRQTDKEQKLLKSFCSVFYGSFLSAILNTELPLMTLRYLRADRVTDEHSFTNQLTLQSCFRFR